MSIAGRWDLLNRKLPPHRPSEKVSARRLLTDIEAAAYLGVSRAFVRAQLAASRLRRVPLPSVDCERPARVLIMLIEGTPRLNALRDARKTVLDADDDAIAWFEEWSFELEGRYTGRKTLNARVQPSVTGRCNQLAHYTLGLPSSTLACLAIEAV